MHLALPEGKSILYEKIGEVEEHELSESETNPTVCRPLENYSNHSEKNHKLCENDDCCDHFEFPKTTSCCTSDIEDLDKLQFLVKLGEKKLNQV